MKLNVGDLVRIDWYDHYSTNIGWKQLSTFTGKVSREVCSSAGLVVGVDKEQVVLAQNWHPNSHDCNIADFMIIMRGCIKKITLLQKKVI